jgi:hypothetical protein
MSGACGMHGREKNAFTILVRRSEGISCLEELGIDGRLIIIWVVKYIIGGCGLDSSNSR